MRKIYKNFIVSFCFAAILSGCGSGLCPLRSSVGTCIASSGWQSAVGILDTSFNGTGIVTTAVLAGHDISYSSIFQPDGKIIALGSTYNGVNQDLALVRYNSNGSLDTSFNGTGIVTTAVLAADDFIYSAVLQPDGKIIAAGYATAANADFALVRYNSDGSLDTSFNGTGMVTTPVLASSDSSSAVVLQPDGKIIAAGLAFNGANNDFALARYNSNGSLDTSFNGTGTVTTPVLASIDVANSVLLQPDGKIVAAGYAIGATYDFALVRYNINGSLDTSFNGTGIVTTPVLAGTDQAVSSHLQSDGKIIAVGNAHNGSNNVVALVRYNSNGTLDTTFNGTGIVTGPSFAGGDVYSSQMQPDGKIIVVGRYFNGANFDFILVRYNTNGSLDTTFNGTGIVTTPILAGSDFAYSCQVQPDGKIIAAGIAHNGTNYDFAVVRYR